MAKKVKIVSPAAGKVLALSATNDEVYLLLEKQFLLS